MNKSKNINLKKSKGPLTVEIRGEKAIAGVFSFAIESESGYLGLFDGKFGDSLADIFIIPVKIEDLENHDLYMTGNFTASNPTSNNIAFVLNFYQGGELVDSDKLQETATGALHVLYTISFKVKD